MTEKLRNFTCINSFGLKWIAIISMIIDHTYKVLYPYTEWYWLKIAGRISFPVFCFLLVEGFFHTRDVKKYIVRLGIFALVSEIPFDLTFFHTAFMWQKQNVFFTLLIGMIMMFFMERTKKEDAQLRFIYLLAASAIAILMMTDYSVTGIVMIFCFYEFKERPLYRNVSAAAVNLMNGGIQCYGVLAIIPIQLYNGKKGPGMKYFFYLFYPLHLILLYLLRVYIYL